jgi:hypothetical protein
VTAAPVVYDIWFVLGVFVANAIGCVLAVFCLVRMADPRRSAGNRIFLVVAAAWGVVETARDDALFVMATAVYLRDDQVRFFLAPSMALTVVSVAVTAVAFWMAARHPRPLWTATAGVTAGLLTGAMVVQSALAGRTGHVTSVDVPAAVAIAGGLAVVTALSVWLATGATARWRVAIPIMVLAIGMTGAQYLVAGKITFDLSTMVDDEIGVNAIHLIFFTVAAFGVRTIALMFLSMTDEGRAERDGEAYASMHRAF